MILQVDHKSMSFSANSEQMHQFHAASQQSELRQFSRMQSQFRQKVRIRQLQKIKALKRKRQLTHIAIEQILQSSFPKQSADAKQWANQLIVLYRQSSIYETDAHKLRQIFQLAQKFPSLSTLHLLYIAILTSSSQSVRILSELNIWSFLHNILKFPEVESKSSNLTQERKEISINEQKQGLQTKMVRIAIESFATLFDKDNAFRDFSIDCHSTYNNHIRIAYKKYGLDIKTEVIYFLKSCLNTEPRKNHLQYKRIVGLVIVMLLQYKEKINQFLQDEGKQILLKQTVEDIIIRIKLLLSIMNQIFGYQKSKWLLQFIGGSLNYSHQFWTYHDYFVIVSKILMFAHAILEHLMRKIVQNNHFLCLYQQTVELLNNSIMFFMNLNQSYVDQNLQSCPLIKLTMGKIVKTLQIIKLCEQKKLFIHAQRDLLLDLQKLKQTSFFAIGNALTSDFDKYENFAKKIIFYEDNSEKIHLLSLIQYFLNTIHQQRLLKELLNVTFILLESEVPQKQIDDYRKLIEIIDKIIDILVDRFTLDTTKFQISTHFLEFIAQSKNKNGKNRLGERLGFGFVLINNYYKIEAFINSSICCQQVFQLLETAIKQLQNHQFFEINI